MTEFRLQYIISKIAMTIDNKSFDQVKDLLRELETGIPQLQKGEWTFCDDELPDKDDTYMVSWYTSDLRDRFYALMEFYDGEWVINLPQAGSSMVIVEAWRELPPLPKEV